MTSSLWLICSPAFPPGGAAKIVIQSPHSLSLLFPSLFFCPSVFLSSHLHSKTNPASSHPMATHTPAPQAAALQAAIWREADRCLSAPGSSHSWHGERERGTERVRERRERVSYSREEELMKERGMVTISSWRDGGGASGNE